MESDQSLGFKEVVDLSGAKWVCEGSSGAGNDGNSGSVMKKSRVSEKVDDDQEVKIEEEPVLKPVIDLNVSVMEEENGECNEFGHGIDHNGPTREVIDISSDVDEDEMLGNLKDDKGKGKVCAMDLDLRLGINGEGGDDVGGERRYTREEKGKSENDYLSLFLASNLGQGDSNLNFEVELDEDDDSEEQELEIAKLPEPIASSHVISIWGRNLAFGDRKEIARGIARFDHERKNEVKSASKEAEMNVKEFSGLFSSALKAITDRNTKQRFEKLIDWNAHYSGFRPPLVPSLLDLSLDVLAKNPDAISSLDHVPEWLKTRLTNLLCDARKMDIHVLEMLLKGSPTEIRVKDCSWMTHTQLVKALEKSDLRNLRVLQLDLCGQCSFDDVICKSLAQSPNSLPYLAVLSLRGAVHLSDSTLKPLLLSAPFIQSINLGQCAFLTHAAIRTLADYLKEFLRELYIDDCPGIDAMRCLPSMKKFEHLEVLSVAGVKNVCDAFVRGITGACGGNLKELDLANCLMLTDRSLEAIGNCCPELCSLNISNLHNYTDLGISYLANGCRLLQSLKIAHGEFSDEAIAAFLEVSGGSLKELSLNHVRKVSFNTAFSLAKCSRKLMSLDLSWCRRITNEELLFIVDNCSSLRLLKIFGCTQISNSFLNCHSNMLVQIVGLDRTPILAHVNMFEPVGALLRYSPLKSPVLPHNGQ